MFVGSITEYIDVPQLILYVFWIFFIGLVIYLQRESRREGFPLRSDKPDVLPHHRVGGGDMPPPKTYHLLDGTDVQLPSGKNDDDRELAVKPLGRFFGAPLVPTGDPLIDGVGPAAWAERSNEPDPDGHGGARIQPLASLGEHFKIAQFSVDPRGLPVVTTLDREVVGTVSEVWVDHMESLPRYYEVTCNDGHKVLLPMMLARIARSRHSPLTGSLNERLIDTRSREVRVASVTSAQFARAPVIASSTSISRREEDQVQAYFGGGHLFATPARSEALI